jgi:hypothetical protein
MKVASLPDEKRSAVADLSLRKAIEHLAKEREPVEPEVTQELIDLMDKIGAELKRQGHPGAAYCRPCIWDAKQSKAMGGVAEPTVGFWSAMPCQAAAAEEAFNAAVEALVVAGASEPEPEPVEDDWAAWDAARQERIAKRKADAEAARLAQKDDLRLAKVLAMLSSTHEGQRQNAADAANAILRPMGWKLVKVEQKRAAPLPADGMATVYVKTTELPAEPITVWVGTPDDLVADADDLGDILQRKTDH